MNKHLAVSMWAFLVLVFVPEVFAQGQTGDADVFSDIKMQMISSTRDNKKLLKENKILKAQLVGLQLEIEQYEREIGKIDPEYIKTREQLKRQNKKSWRLSDPEDDDLIREAQEMYLSGRYLASDGVQKLRELYLYDLQYQKQEMELDRELLQLLKQKVKEHRGPQNDTLEREIQENIERTRDISMRITQEEKAALDYPREMELLEMENKALKQKINRLQKMSR